LPFWLTRIPGDRLQQEGLDQPGSPAGPDGAVQHRPEHHRRRVRIVLGQPQHRAGDAHLAPVAVPFAQVGKGLRGRLGLAEPYQGVHDPHRSPSSRSRCNPRRRSCRVANTNPQLRRGPQHQQLQLLLRLVRAQLVHVVEDQPQRLVQRRQVLQQPLDHRPPVQVRRRRQLPHQL
jgi:hypothetical protein